MPAGTYRPALARGRHWTAEEVLPSLDKCVAYARATSLSIIINYHNVGEQQRQEKSGQLLDFTRLADFWRLVAPRYKDQAHVFYELSHEPGFDGARFLKPEFRTGLMGVNARFGRMRRSVGYCS